MNKKYGIFNKSKLEVASYETTKNSRYDLAVLRGTSIKKFITRQEARSYKRTLKNPQQYAIVNIPEFAVVR